MLPSASSVKVQFLCLNIEDDGVWKEAVLLLNEALNLPELRFVNQPLVLTEIAASSRSSVQHVSDLEE